MSSAPAAQPTQAENPTPPGIRLMLYRANVAGLDAARGVQCDDAWLDLDGTPVRLHARKPIEDADTEEHPPPRAPMGRVEAVRARLEARGPSRLRYEVRPLEDVPAATVDHHKRRRGDTTSPGASSAVVGGHRQPAGAGLYGARRGPSTGSPRARMTTTRAEPTSSRRVDATRVAADDAKQPPRTSRPTGRALAVHQNDRRSSVALATAGSPRPTISAPMPLQRKRRHSEGGDAAQGSPAKHPANKRAKHASSTLGPLPAASSVLVGRHVQRSNNTLPPPSSRALSGTPVGVERKGWRRRIAEAWSATIHALAAAVTAARPATKT